MFGSIYIGLSGLTAYSRGLQAISNNVSNLNSTGYKSADVTFSDLYGPRSLGSLQYGQSFGGSGHGVTMNDLSTNFGQGELRQTTRDLDLAVDGNGFLVLLDGDNVHYARTGSFFVNEEGFIVLDGTDYKLAALDETGRPVAVNVDSARTDAPEATNRVVFADNLSSTATEYNIPSIRVYDASGEESVWSVNFTRAETEFDNWTVTVTNAAGETIGVQQLVFLGGIITDASRELVFADEDAGLDVTFDFSENVTSFSTGTVSSLRAADVNGHATGTIATLRINDQGAVEVAYTNQEERELGPLALADFRDPQSLEQRSGALFDYSGFGQLQYLSARDERVGTVMGNRLEASNVDLGKQFGELILIQRGFQASSQIISVTNDMIQQLFGIRGQG